RTDDGGELRLPARPDLHPRRGRGAGRRRRPGPRRTAGRVVTAPADLAAMALRVQMPGFPGTTLDDQARALFAEGLGGVCLFGRDTEAGPDAVARLTAAIHDLAPAAVVAVDEEGGDVTRLHATSGSPVLGAAALGVVDDPELTRATGRAVGTELAALGI